MTDTDRKQSHPGYWPSAWPVECGGNRRQKSRAGRLDAGMGSAEVVFRNTGRWNVMAIECDPGQWFIGGTMAAFSGPTPYGWVEKIDPLSLEPIAFSGELPCGEHVWCGAILAHANGSIYSVNGSFLHRLSPDCEVEAETRLPMNRAHNGLLALSDGSLITKDLRLEGQGPTTLTRLDAETLEVMEAPLELPEGSMGRIAADQIPGGDAVYVPGTEHMWRIDVREKMRIAEGWRPRYRHAQSEFGLAWDSCLSDDSAWLMDCGDIQSVREIFSVHPNGRFEQPPTSRLGWRHPAPWNGAQRLLRISLTNGEVETLIPFGNAGGGIIAPPVHIPELHRAVCWDSLRGGLAGIDTSGSRMSVAWTQPVRPSMQPVVFPESGELVINDFTESGSDDLVVVNLESGEILDRVQTGSRIANGMFLSPGSDRDIFYCSTLGIARVSWH